MNNLSPPRVLFVCLGNICRSPTAEAVMRALAPEWRIDSAGTAGWHAGDAPYPPMIAAAAQRGFDLSPLRARQFSAADFAAFDLIVGMDADNVAGIETLRPDGAQAKVTKLLAFAPNAGAQDVPDPYYTRDFDAALDLIEIGCRALLDDYSAP